MFSTEEKHKIAAGLEKILLDINHPGMPKDKPRFKLQVNGSESWSWALIIPNWLHRIRERENLDAL